MESRRLNLTTGTLNYRFPSRTDCLTCHNASTPGPLGFQVKQLDLMVKSGNRDINQLKLLTEKNILSTQPQNTQKLEPYGGNPKNHSISYLDVHCSSCHNNSGGPGRGDFDLTAAALKQLSKQELCDLNGQANFGRQEGLFAERGTQNKSILARISSSDPELRMPPVATVINNQTHISALQAWVQQLGCP